MAQNTGNESMCMDSPLKIATFNTRGMLDLKKRRELFRKLKKDNLDIIALQETHLYNDDQMKDLINLWGGPAHYTPGTNRSKGLITLLHPRFSDKTFTKLWISDRVIISKINIGESTIIIVNVYCPCENGNKIDFLIKLQTDIISKLSPSELGNCIVLGDFNIAISPLDVISGMPHNINICNQFNIFIQSLSLKDTWRSLHPNEKCYTWLQPTHNLPAARRLDYILAGEGIGAMLKCSEVKSIGISDHRLVTSTFNCSTFKRGKGLYKLNTSLLEDDTYVSLIIHEIQRTLNEYVNCNPHVVWEMIKVNIREFSQLYSKAKAKEKREKLQDLQRQLQHLENEVAYDPLDQNKWNHIARCKKDIEIIELYIAKGAQIRSQEKYIEDGEKCTKYFLSLEKSRSESNTITRLKNSSGETVTNEHKLLEEIRVKYKHRYNQSKSTYSQVSDLMDEYIRGLDLPSLSEEEKVFCDSPVLEQEVHGAVHAMNSGSAPGNDGIPTEFYAKFWSYVKGPLLKCYNFSFLRDILSPSEKIGVLSLFHKGKDLAKDDLDNWRPISLLNADYKILAKVLSIRLNKVIDKLIGKQQFGFMKGRQISHMHRFIDDLLTLQRKSNLPGFILALDFKQAFDAINIKCILKSLHIFGFGPNFIRWISILNTDRQSCVKNGGYISELFPMSNGVRQGCPISPQLFLLAVEILAQKIVQDSNICGLNPHGGSQSKKIGQFADDVTLCLKHLNDLRICNSHLNGFSKFSDLFLNLNKSYALSTNGMAVDTGGIPIKFTDTIKILGMYYSNKCPADEIEKNWTPRINKIVSIFNRWSKRNLSLIGKIHIVKTFGLSQLVFIMKSIAIPRKVLEDVNTLFFKFVWKKQLDNKKAFEKIKRNVLCNDYLNGGLRMIDIRHFQDSILLEWAHSFITSPVDSPWADVAATFF